jgi:UDP-hydrolysing UDP-N-acetyl-D-glucosamine 2-epimerase
MIPRRVAVLTTGRQDWGILRSTCLLLASDARFDPGVISGGMHLDQRFGAPDALLREDGIEPAARAAFLGAGSPASEAGRAVAAIGDALEVLAPEMLVLVGDRSETAAAALAATVLRIPIVHLHGGEVTLGAVDDVLRQSITKMSHLHLVSHPRHARRVAALGEDPASIHVVGAPGLDNLHRDDLPDRAALEASLGLELAPPVVAVAVHPVTLAADPAATARAVAGAMDRVAATYVVSLPNADPGNEDVRAILRDAATGPRRSAVEALGATRHWALLRVADAIVGNSSSALIEAPAVGLPAVDVGERQRGRLRGATVLEAPDDDAAVADALARAIEPAFRRSLPVDSPYGDGRSAARIVEILAAWSPPDPPRKPVFGDDDGR